MDSMTPKQAKQRLKELTGWQLLMLVYLVISAYLFNKNYEAIDTGEDTRVVVYIWVVGILLGIAFLFYSRSIGFHPSCFHLLATWTGPVFVGLLLFSGVIGDMKKDIRAASEGKESRRRQ